MGHKGRAAILYFETSTLWSLSGCWSIPGYPNPQASVAQRYGLAKADATASGAGGEQKSCRL
ncbi:MAG: hypothetical protein OXI38_05905 [Bacteroidota bacterium]|nr:hypothetical protein [Bacteroidota bacterium]